MKPVIFDSHAHYDASQFDPDRGEVLDALPGQGVAAVMCVADTLQSAQRGAELAGKYNYIYCSAGVHPHEAKSAEADLEERLTAFAGYEKCRAIGEIGLDYHYDFSPREKQREVFERQLRLAKDLDLPVIVHDREAHADIMDLLNKYRPKGIVHCYSGSAEMAKEILKLGMYIGFTGAVTFPKARKALEALAVIPMDRLLVETDCPYMAPVPLRGQRSDSSMIVHTARVMAGIKGVEPEELLEQTCRNACAVYGIPVEEVLG